MIVIPVLAARNTMATSMDIIDDMVFGIFTGCKNTIYLLIKTYEQGALAFQGFLKLGRFLFA
jgi:hypothetical protein